MSNDKMAWIVQHAAGPIVKGFSNKGDATRFREESVYTDEYLEITGVRIYDAA